MNSENNKARKYLVTGADGFIGQRVLKYLSEQGFAVRAMSRRESNVFLPGNSERVIANLEDKHSLAQALDNVTHVIHLAGRVHIMNNAGNNSLRDFRKINVEGTRNVIEAAISAGVKHFLFASSVKAMGENAIETLDEHSLCSPTTPYGTSKYEAEQLVLSMGKQYGIHVAILRLPMVYGPGNKGNMLSLIKKAAKRSRLPFGAIKNKRSMVYVDNVVEAILFILSRPETDQQVYIVSDETAYSAKDLYEAIGEAFNFPLSTYKFPVSLLKLFGCIGSLLEFLTRRQMPINIGIISRVADSLLFNNNKLNNIGFKPRYSLKYGVSETVKWYQSTFPDIKENCSK